MSTRVRWDALLLGGCWAIDVAGQPTTLVMPRDDSPTARAYAEQWAQMIADLIEFQTMEET